MVNTDELARRPSRRGDPVAVLDTCGQRFLDHHVAAVFKRLDHVLRVGGRRSEHVDHVRALIKESFNRIVDS